MKMTWFIHALVKCGPREDFSAKPCGSKDMGKAAAGQIKGAMRMRTISYQTSSHEMEARLSTLWVFIMVNMLAADIFSFMLAGSAASAAIKVTQGMMLAFAAVIEIPIAMIFLSRVLGPRVNRLANMAACTISIAFVIAGGSPDLHYLFFATIEVITMLMMIRACWNWKGQKPETRKENYERRAI